MKRLSFRHWLIGIVVINLVILGVRISGLPSENRSIHHRTLDYLRFQTQYHSGLMSLAVDDRPDALTHFNNALELNPASFSSRMHVTRLLQWLGSDHLNRLKSQGAVEYFSRLHQLDPGNPPAALFMAGECARTYKPATALQILHGARSEPGWTLALEIARQKIQLGQGSAEFSRWIADTVKDNSSIVWLWIVAGDIHWMNNDFVLAENAYRQAVTIGSGNRFVNIRRGFLWCLEYDKPDNACKYLSRAFPGEDHELFRLAAEEICCTDIKGEKSEFGNRPDNPMNPGNLRHEQEIMLTHVTGFWDFLHKRLRKQTEKQIQEQSTGESTGKSMEDSH